MPQSVSEWLGILGFLLACVALYFQWMTHRREKQAYREEREAKVSVRAVYGPLLNLSPPGWYLQVFLVNVGRTPVYLKSVAVCFHSAERSEGRVIPEMNPQKNPVQLGDDRTYCLTTNDYPVLSTLREIPASNIEIQVATPEKVIHTVAGRNIGWIGIATPEEVARTGEVSR